MGSVPIAMGALIVGCQSGVPAHRSRSGIAHRAQFPDIAAHGGTAQDDRAIVAGGATPHTDRQAARRDAEPLPPDDSGLVFVETKSGKTRCQISEDAVGCEAQFINSPTRDGLRANGVNVTADGNVEWLVGNLGDMPVVTLDYRTYRALGWTIAASSDGTRFTNGDTGHGMFVSVEKVETF